jgi:hypothetical protein
VIGALNFALMASRSSRRIVSDADKQARTDETWIYDPSGNAWTNLPAPAPKGTDSGGGNNLCYDPDDGVFLLKHSSDLTKTYALKYVGAASTE